MGEMQRVRGIKLVLLFSMCLQLTGSHGEGKKCSEGFVSRETLQERSMFLGAFSQSEGQDQRIFPSLNITCPTIIRSFRIIASTVVTNNRYPALQVWRPENEMGTEFTKIHETAAALKPVFGSDSNLYQSISLSVPVERGDVFGYYQPAIDKSRYVLYYQTESRHVSWRKTNVRSAPDDFRTRDRGVEGSVQDFPLVGVIADNIECISGFLTEIELSAKRDLLSNPILATTKLTQHGNQRRIIPGVPFACSGVINSVTFTAKQASGRLYPIFQVWRQDLWNRNLYTRRNQVLLAQPSIGDHLNTFKFRLSVPIQVEEGDVVGLLLPALNDVALILQFVPSGQNSSWYLESTSSMTVGSSFVLNNSIVRLDYDLPLLQVEMTAADCGVPPSPQHGEVSYQNTSYLSVASYQCEAGYALEGSSLRQCTSSGTWSQTHPVCTGVKCSSLAFPMHGRVVVHGGVAVYSCEVNHTLLGLVNRTCTNSSWTGVPPKCVADCAPPSLLPGRTLHSVPSLERVLLGTVAIYTCVEGYTTATGILMCSKDSKWVGDLPKCEAVICEELKSPDNGHVYLTNETLYGSVAYYNCSHGYDISGDSPRICSTNGQWSGNDTTLCVPTAISKPTAPRSEPPPPLNTLYLAVITVIAVLVIIILIMVFTITVLCVKRRQYKTMQMNIDLTTLNNTSLNNPTYEGDQRLSFSLWDPNLNVCRYQFRDSSPGSNESIYDQPIQSEQGTLGPPPPSLPRPSLHYEMSSVVTPSSLRFVDYLCDEWGESGHHYDTASNYRSSLYDLPASPYEVPTPTLQSKVSMADIYGSLPWGSFVLTEDQRTSPSPPSAASPLELCRKSQSRSSLDQVFFAESEVYWRPATNSASLYEQLARNRYREILREQIQVTVHLGSGQFGTVDRGLWQSPVGVREVAIKTLKTTSTEEDKIKFLQEAAISGQFQHRNVVKLYGVVTMGEPVMIVLELLVNGDLRNYLIRFRPEPGELVPSDTPQMLLQFCADVAAGMVYLSNKAFVHRDLAARNILLTKGKTCKIGDFGLSRDLEDESYYISHGGEIPVKWTAPEALHYKRYSTASDVWSFGCVMYEIWSLGHKPFGGCSNTEAVNLIDRGFRLPPPPGSARVVYQIMIQCWHPVTSHRPTFTELYQRVCVDLSPLSLHETTPHHRTVLGGSLETAKDLYPDLQNFYT